MFPFYVSCKVYDGLTRHLLRYFLNPFLIFQVSSYILICSINDLSSGTAYGRPVAGGSVVPLRL